MAYKKKKKEEKIHIDEFSKKFESLHKLTKPRSPNTIEFMSDDLPDKWLVDLVVYRNKSGVVQDSFTILQKDVTSWLDKYKKEGWVLLT